MPFTYRLVKGSALSWSEMDNNLIEIEDKYTASLAAATTAEAEADAAAASAASALTAPGTNATSTSSMLIGTGSKTFTVQTGKSFVVGQFVVIASTASPSNYMLGQITAYTSGTGSMTVAVGTIGGSGTLAAWTVSVSAPNGNFLTTDTGLPRLKPTLLLDFANSQSVDSRITFTRASTATRFNKFGVLETVAAGVPRIDYDPVTGACKGLLIEELRQNIATYSEDLSNAAWTKFAATVSSNATTAPDGALTADKVVEDTAANSRHFVYLSPSVTTGLSYTWSVFAKAAERSKLRLDAGDGQAGAGNYADFDLVAGTATPAGNCTASVQAVGNGWFRLSCTFSTVSSGTSALTIELATTAGSSTYTGDGTSGLYVWGAQLEAGAFPTSYIPTTTAAVTRNAELALITGTNFSSWYNQLEGSVLVDFILNRGTASVGVATIGNSAAPSSNSVQVRYSSGTNAQYQVLSGGAVSASIAPVGYAAAGQHIRAVGFKANSFFQAVDGATPNGEDTSGAMPIGVNQLEIGSESSTNQFSGHIRRLAYYPKRVTNAELTALSSF